MKGFNSGSYLEPGNQRVPWRFLMIKYNKVVDLTRVGYEYTQSDSMAGYTLTSYYLDGQLHRTDGVAMHYDYSHGDDVPYRPDEGYYYINDRQIYGKELKVLKEAMVCSISELPKFINDPIAAPIMKERLNGAL